MSPSKTILLAGKTGVFGRHLTRVLDGAGYRVIGLGRGEANDCRADLNDRDQVLRAVAGVRADIVVHAATALAKPPTMHRDMAGTDRLRTVGMRHLVAAAREVGAVRLITENMIFGYGYGPHPAEPLAERDEFGPTQADRRLDAHTSAMRVKEELTFGVPGVEGVSLRFGLFYGPGGTDAVVAMLRKRMLPAPRSRGALPWVHLDDAATATLAAIERGSAGEAYNIVDDDPMSFGDHVRAVARAFGTPRPRSVPVALLRPASMLHAILRTDMRVSNRKAADELGWRPAYPTLAGGLAATVAAASAASAPA